MGRFKMRKKKEAIGREKNKSENQKKSKKVRGRKLSERLKSVLNGNYNKNVSWYAENEQ